MEIFRNPAHSTTQLQDILYVTANLTISEDYTVTDVYVAAGVTLTLAAGYTLTCSTLTADGDFISNGTALVTGASTDVQINFSSRKEVFREVSGDTYLSVTASLTERKEAFRNVSNNTTLETFP